LPSRPHSEGIHDIGGWDGGGAQLLEREGDPPGLDRAIDQLEAAGFAGRDLRVGLTLIAG
jgi:hypothetical protein